ESARVRRSAAYDRRGLQARTCERSRVEADRAVELVRDHGPGKHGDGRAEWAPGEPATEWQPARPRLHRSAEPSCRRAPAVPGHPHQEAVMAMRVVAVNAS